MRSEIIFSACIRVFSGRIISLFIVVESISKYADNRIFFCIQELLSEMRKSACYEIFSGNFFYRRGFREMKMRTIISYCMGKYIKK